MPGKAAAAEHVGTMLAGALADTMLAGALAVVLEIAQEDPRVDGRGTEWCRYCDGTARTIGGTLPHEPDCLWERCRELAEDHA